MAESMNVSLETNGPRKSSVNVSIPFYDGSFPARKWFGEVEEYFELNKIPGQNQLRFAWDWLSGKAKSWVKLNLQQGFNATYAQLKEVLELAFPDTHIKWVLETDLHGKLQKKREDSREFVMRKLELMNQLNIGLVMCDKVELITSRMLPYVQEKSENKRINTITKILKHINKLNSFPASLDENLRFHRRDGYHEQTNRSFHNFEGTGIENSNRNGNSNDRDNRRFQNRNNINDLTSSPQVIEIESLIPPNVIIMFVLHLLDKIEMQM